jgi:hypothetical protein
MRLRTPEWSFGVSRSGHNNRWPHQLTSPFHTGIWTQGFLQVFYHLSHISSFLFFWDKILLLELSILPPLPLEGLDYRCTPSYLVLTAVLRWLFAFFFFFLVVKADNLLVLSGRSVTVLMLKKIGRNTYMNFKDRLASVCSTYQSCSLGQVHYLQIQFSHL